jgi:iron-sulfur cluster repair protein YtfE (RIC family)
MTTAPPFALGTRTADEPEPDLTSIVVVHRAMRQDLRRLAACLGQITTWGVPPTQSRAVCRYTMALLAEIRAHHRGEDDIFWPVIAAAAGHAVDLTPLTDDHQAIEAAASRAIQALASFTGEPSPFAVKLYASVSELRDMLDEHVADEEDQIFPIMRRYLPAKACQWCEKQVQRNASLRDLRFTAPWLARYAQPDELSRLLATGGRRVRILLAAARPGYARLERQAFGVSAAVRYQR